MDRACSAWSDSPAELACVRRQALGLVVEIRQRVAPKEHLELLPLAARGFLALEISRPSGLPGSQRCDDVLESNAARAAFQGWSACGFAGDLLELGADA